MNLASSFELAQPISQSLVGCSRNLEDIFHNTHLLLKPRTPVPKITVEFYPFAGLTHTARLDGPRLAVRLSDICRDAPGNVYESIAWILLGRLYRKKVDSRHHRIYRLFRLRQEIHERAQAVRSLRGRTARTADAAGRHVNLETVFDHVNRQYFGGALKKPKLSWSAKKSRYVLGRYDALHQIIIISRILDSPELPGFVVAYIMFHEMLHIKHRSCAYGDRMVVHSREFKDEERRFREYEEARRWLKGF